MTTTGKKKPASKKHAPVPDHPVHPERVRNGSGQDTSYWRTLGGRLKRAMMDADLDSSTLMAKRVGVRSHATILNWINNERTPKRAKLQKAAQVLGVSYLYLAEGLEGPTEAAEKLNQALIQEVTFGKTPADRKAVHTWGVPVPVLGAMQIVDTKLAIIYQVDYQAGKYESGDRVLVDGSHRNPSPGADFLFWSGTAPAIGRLSVPIVPSGRKPVVKVRAFVDGGKEETTEVDADKLVVIGRLKGTWRQA